jgi:glycosyltransferase involved in cell wall biosynthesis
LSDKVTFHGFGRLFRGLLLRRLVRQLEPDICHGHLSAACKALGRIRGQHQSVATLHVGYKPHQHGGLDGVICVNRAQSTRLGSYAGQVRTIANWLPSAAPATAAPGLRAALGIAPGTFVVGAVGRLHESKGADVLIAAFKHVAPANAALVILGEGPQRAALAKLADGDLRIHLPGYRADVQECLNEFDLFVSPSREESFGLAIVEAMSRGLPLVATSAEGPAEFLMDQPVSLVEPGSVMQLATALDEAAGRFRAGELGRIAYDLSRFDPEARVANVMDFYDSVIHARQAAVVRAWAHAAFGT